MNTYGNSEMTDIRAAATATCVSTLSIKPRGIFVLWRGALEELCVFISPLIQQENLQTKSVGGNISMGTYATTGVSVVVFMYMWTAQVIPQDKADEIKPPSLPSRGFRG